PDGLPKDDTHAFIVLGYALKENGEMEDELIGRLKVALNSAEKYPNSYVLVTGGVEKNGWTEGDRMKDWLDANGLSEDRIIIEDEIKGRLKVAINNADKYTNSYVLVTGGVEKNGWTEGDRMKDWLVANGLSEDRIIVENESSKTVENAAFSYDILYNDYNIET